MVDNEPMAQPIELAGGDPGPDMGRDEVERLGGKHAGPPHALKGFRSVDFDRPLARLVRRQPHHHILLHAAIVRILPRRARGFRDNPIMGVGQ